jgi:hypothetical protein
MQVKLYQELAQLLIARSNCLASKHAEWASKHEDKILALVKDHMPSGSGFDCGTGFDLDKSTPDKLVFNTSFHHMADCGMYDGWTEHTITVKPSLAFGFTLRITGKNRNDIKSIISEDFDNALNSLAD